MRPTLRQLRYLVAIADSGRFGLAAKALNVSQPSLSAQIADMEAELGETLVERGRKGAIMTPVGTEVLRRARLILREVEDLKAIARNASRSLSGRMRLGVLPSVGPYLLPSATKQLHALYPDFRMSVREEKTVDLESHLDDGQFDMILSTPDDHPGRPSMPILEEHLWICAAPDDGLSGSGHPVPLEALAGRALLTLGEGHRLSRLIDRIAFEAGGHVSSEYQGTSLDATRQMAIMGAGVAVLPSLYVTGEAKRDPDIVVRRIDHPMARRTISLVWRENSPLESRFHAIGKVLRETAAAILGDSAQA